MKVKSEICALTRSSNISLFIFYSVILFLPILPSPSSLAIFLVSCPIPILLPFSSSLAFFRFSHPLFLFIILFFIILILICCYLHDVFFVILFYALVFFSAFHSRFPYLFSLQPYFIISFFSCMRYLFL
jgi:hypothetical protein